METTELVNALNTYPGENPWQDVILPSGAYSETASEELDPGGSSDRFVTSAGQLVAWDAGTRHWRDAGDYGGTGSDDAARWRP